MLTIDELATRLNVHRNTIRSLIKKGEISAIKVGTQYRIPEHEYDRFVTASRVKEDQVVAGSKKIS
jgi:excisionase family DNA binding protein